MTIFTSTAVVEEEARKRRSVQTRKRRGIEKRQEIARLMAEYKHEVAQLEEIENSRVRRSTTTVSNFPTFSFVLVILAAVFLTALPIHRL